MTDFDATEFSIIRANKRSTRNKSSKSLVRGYRVKKEELMLFTFRRKNVQNNSYPGKRFFINREEQSRRKMYSHKQVARVERYASMYYFQQAEFWMEFVSKEKKKKGRNKERKKGKN